MNIGDTVTVTGKYCPFRVSNKRLIHHMVMRATKVIYLGKTTLQEGDIDWEDSYEGESTSLRYLKVTRLVPVLVFQPLHATGQRYRKPFYAALEDVETNEQ